MDRGTGDDMSASPATPGRTFVLRDPMFGDIKLTDAERRVLDSDIFQRQRGVKQLGTSMLLYPAAVQTRFVHALGNLRIAGDMIAAALNSNPGLTTEFLSQARAWLVGLAPAGEERGRIELCGDVEIRDRVEQVVRIAGMCHDLGHFPMGHVLEDALSDPEILELLVRPEEATARADWVTLREAAVHEFATIQLLDGNGGGRFSADGPARARPFDAGDEWLRLAVLDVIKATHAKPKAPPPNHIARTLAELISSEIDSDRAEYLRRDSAVTGAGYGQYDIERLTDSYTIARRADRSFVIRPSTRALAAVETFLLERVKAYGHLYYHNLGYLMDALLGVVLRSLYRPSDVGVLRAEIAAPERLREFESVLKGLPLDRLHYDNFDDPSGYVDDASLWEFLRATSRWLESLGTLHAEQVELRRVRLYLRALLRRRHVWVSLWKSPEEFTEISNQVLPTLAQEVRSQHPRVTEVVVADAIARVLSKRTSVRIAAPRASVLNFFAHEYRKEGRLQELARVLERQLRGRKPRWLAGDVFVEVGERAKFRPLKAPAGYEIIDGEGALRPLREVAQAAVDAIMAWWYDGYPQLRMYVVTEDELPRERREELRVAAAAELPEAVATWWRGLPQKFDPLKVISSDVGGDA